MKLRPLYDRIIVKRVEQQRKTAAATHRRGLGPLRELMVWRRASERVLPW